MGQKYKCPSCGAELELKYRFSKMVVCQYCGVTSYLQNNALQYKGAKVELANYGSVFEVGKSGKIDNQHFQIIGQLRFAYTDGFWDEWLLFFDNAPETEYWLHEDEGDLILYTANQSDKYPDFASIEAGVYFQTQFGKVFITEKSTAQILGSAGELTFSVIKGEQANFVDGIVYSEGKLISFEYMPAEKACSIGKPVSLYDIQFD